VKCIFAKPAGGSGWRCAAANGKKVKLEFRLTSDPGGVGPRKGWFVDDVRVYAKP
jgi:hypothetical protein